MMGECVTPVKEPNLSSGKRLGMMVYKVSKVSEDERSFLEIAGDALFVLTRGAASENPIFTVKPIYKINSKGGDMYIIKDVNLMLNFSSPLKPSNGLSQTFP